jgi:hypothetical protein
MNYSEIDTAEQLLNAFKQCQNAGEEIQLFESLAERENPPVDAFVEILRKIKLETVLALAIQAFGKITNDDVKARLKGSEDLLAMLCEQAKSGATDLIRWSAATTIEDVGFSFIDVCQYLTEEPTGIIQRIVQSNVKVLTDAERNRHSIAERNDYDSFIRFWVYGATNELWAASVSSEGENAAIVVNAVVEAQDLWGVNRNNYWLRLSFDKSIDENTLFTAASQRLSSELLYSSMHSFNISPVQFQVLLIDQIYCLNSKDLNVRELASNCLYQCGNIVNKVSIDSCIAEAVNGLKNSVDIMDITSQKLGVAYKEEMELKGQLKAIDSQLEFIDREISSISSKLVSLNHH